jgi:hypothetical protein
MQMLRIVLRLFVALVAAGALGTGAGAAVVVPAYSAYGLPDFDSFRTSERSGITRWNDPGVSVNWYGKFAESGAIDATVAVRAAKGQQVPLRLTIGSRASDQVVVGTGDKQSVDFGRFEVEAGYVQIKLESLAESPGPIAGVIELVVSGPASEGAHFNTKERRNAASVHLRYDVPRDAEVDAFYAEVTGVTDPAATFYMACGWHRGYFGMQVNSATERRIIFSVWDSGNEGVDRNKVEAENRVQLVDKGEGVYSGDFGNEGTGGHSHLKTMWKTGEVQRFVVTARRDDDTHTTFAGYYFNPDKQQWMLISAWRAPKEGGYLRGLHGFSENFWGSSGHVVRKSLHANQWMRTTDGQWHELTKASFSHDPTGRTDRLDRSMGVEEGAFFLQHGGFVDGFTKYGETFTRPATNTPPQDLELPPLP